MGTITVSAKISDEMAQGILDLDFSTSDVIQVGLQLFLDLPKEEQVALIEAHLRRKKHERAMERYKNIKGPNSL